MNIDNCPRCGTLSSDQQNRLITDSCGHRKCRRCLLADEEGCLECLQQEITTAETQEWNREVEGGKPPKRNTKNKKAAIPIPDHIQRMTNSAGILHYRCALCNKTFSRSQQYYHLHCGNNDAKKYPCTHCEKRFSARSHLKYHLETHSTQVFACKQCNKVFKNHTVLKKHQKLHAEIKLYACNDCSKVFRSQGALAAHVEKHRNNLRFQCKICDKKYGTKSALQQHLHKHLGKKHQCTLCGKRFQRNSTLKLHLGKHSKTDFICTTCFKKFSDAGSLQRHMKLHEADCIKYKCIYCDIISIRKDNLLRHVRNIHIGEEFSNCVEVIQPVKEEHPSYAEPGSSQNEQAFVPKVVENSSVIRCIGNVEPVKVPDLTDSVDSALTQTNVKKKYDPIKMYRKILIDDECDEELPSQGKEHADVPSAEVSQEFPQAIATKTDSVEPQRASLNSSNFTEMHWRKNFKYTYEYREY